jgi:transcriptional regulator
MRFERETLKGTTETLVLAALAHAPGHGYELIERVKRRSSGIFELGEGTLYPLLYKLEARGWISGRWENGGGDRRRRVYRITSAGRKRLGERAQEWTALVEGMNLILGGACT